MKYISVVHEGEKTYISESEESLLSILKYNDVDITKLSIENISINDFDFYEICLLSTQGVEELKIKFSDIFQEKEFKISLEGNSFDTVKLPRLVHARGGTGGPELLSVIQATIEYLGEHIKSDLKDFPYEVIKGSIVYITGYKLHGKIQGKNKIIPINDETKEIKEKYERNDLTREEVIKIIGEYFKE